MFSAVKDYHSDYKNLMEIINLEYSSHENPLMGAYKNLHRIKNVLNNARKKFIAVKELFFSSYMLQYYVKKNNIDIDVIKKKIELIDTYLEYVLKAIILVKKHPNYLEALKVEKQNQIIEKQKKILRELWWISIKTPLLRSKR